MLGTAGTDGGTTSMIGAFVVGAGAIAGAGTTAGVMLMPEGVGTSEVFAGAFGSFFGGVLITSPAGTGIGAGGTVDAAQPPVAQPLVL